MTAERWQLIERLYHEAEALDQPARDAFLAEVCGEDAGLRNEVWTLLAAGDRSPRFIETPAIALVAELAATAPKITPGQLLIGRYELGELVGSGGMGDVYRAFDHRLDRAVAVKILPPLLADDPAALRHFEREAKAVAALSHPNILAIHDFAAENRIYFAVTELLEGETLRERLDRAPITREEAVAIGAAVAGGLAAAHSNGIVHRDIKPQNIFLTAAGDVKILDFGIAHTTAHRGAISQDDPTRDAVGTPGYMSPEQTQGCVVGPASDIFALGCVLKDMDATLARRGPLARVIERATAPAPADRWTSADEMAQALRQCLVRPQRWWQSRAALSTAIVVGIFSLLGFTWWRTVRAPASPAPVQQPISISGESHRSPSLSPDGQRVAFIHTANEVDQVWISRLDGSDARQVTFGDVPARRPRWSPKGNEIVFVRRVPPEASSIWSVDVDGGPTRRILENARNPSWSWDGESIVFERGWGIWFAKPNGDSARRVEGIPTVDILLADRYPAFSPDGTLIAFFQAASGAPMGDFWVIPATGGEARRLTTDAVFGGAPAWLPDGRFLVFPSARAGSTTLWKIAVDNGGQAEPLLVGPGEDAEPDISRDGRSLVYSHTRNQYAMVITDPATGETRSIRESRSALVMPSFSPQGNRVLFFEVPTGVGQLFTMNTDGSGLTQITHGPNHSGLPQWSANGETVFYYQHEPSPPRGSFRRIAADGSGTSVELAAGWDWDSHNSANVDAAGTRIIYSRLQRLRPVATLVRDLETGRDTQLPRALDMPLWSGDGASVLGVIVGSNPPRGDVVMCTADGASCRTVAAGGFNAQWSDDYSRIYFLRGGAPSPEVWSVSRNGGDEGKVATLAGFHGKNFYDVGRDGRIVWVRFNRGVSELWRMELAVR